jgi:hypothetical protein
MALPVEGKTSGYFSIDQMRNMVLWLDNVNAKIDNALNQISKERTSHANTEPASEAGSAA